jgi:hypothetical protein
MVKRRETRQRAAQPNVDDDIVVIPGPLEGALEPNSPSSAGAGRSAHTSPARLIFTTGFAFSLFLVLVAFLEDRLGNVVIFAILASGFLLMLVRVPRNRPSS